MSPRQKFDRSLIPEHPNLIFEHELWVQGLCLVAGVDEAGRGALAGPVAAGAVILPSDADDLEARLAGVRDSKEMTPQAREVWAETIKAVAVAWGVGFADAHEIDRIGILPATCLAAARAVEKLNCTVEHLLVDYIALPDIQINQTPLVKGDARSLSIAAASVLAKTARDALLVQMDGQFPGYGFAQNKGYATEMHRKAIGELGPCDQHRCTFAPVRDYFSFFPPRA